MADMTDGHEPNKAQRGNNIFLNVSILQQNYTNRLEPERTINFSLGRPRAVLTIL